MTSNIPKFHTGGIIRSDELVLYRGCTITIRDHCYMHGLSTRGTEKAWNRNTLYCNECQDNLQIHLKNKSIKELNMMLLRGDLREYVKTEVQRRHKNV